MNPTSSSDNKRHSSKSPCTRRSNSGRNKLLLALLAPLLALLSWAYWPTLQRIVNVWDSNPDYSHGYLVIPIALAILWARKGLAPADVQWGFHGGGLALLASAAALRIVSGRLYLPELDAWSIPLWVGGVVWLLAGWNWFRWAAPAIVFLWFATPLPATLEIMLSTPLQRLAATLSAGVLRVLGQGAVAEGTTILLDDHVLEVERACSGLRMFYSILALSFACVALTRPSRLKAGIILLSTGPIAVCANVARITATGLLMKYLSGEAAHKFSHDFAGLAMIPLAAIMLGGVTWFLSSLSKRHERDAKAATSWLLRWGGAVAVVAAVAFGWSWFQQERAYGSLLDAANRLQQEGNFPQAVQYLNRYVVARPGDSAALVKLAELVRDGAISRPDKLRAIQLERAAWSQEPSRIDLALTAAKTAVELEEFPIAIAICDDIDAMTPAPEVTAQLTQLRADALLGQMLRGEAQITTTWEDVDNALQDAINLKPYEIRHVAARAEVLRERLTTEAADRKESADSLMERLIVERPQSAEAWVARSEYRRRYASAEADPAAAIAAADEDLARAAELVADTPGREAAQILMLAASRNVELKSDVLAVKQLNAAMKAHPSDVRPYLALAELQRRSSDSTSIQQATETLEIAREKSGGDNFSVMLALASLYAEAGDYQKADELLTPLETLAPRVVGSQRGGAILTTGLVRAQILANREGPQQAIDMLRRLLESSEVQLVQRTQPTVLAEAWGLLAKAYLQVGSPDLASEAYERATQITPNQLQWRKELAAAAAQAGDLTTAQRLYEQMASVTPNSAASWLEVAALELQIQSRLDASAQRWNAFDGALAKAAGQSANPLAIELLTAQRLAAEGHLDKAQTKLESVAEKLPKEPRVWRALAIIRQQAGDPEGALAAIDKLQIVQPNSLETDAMRASLLMEQSRADEALQIFSDKFVAASADKAAEIGAAFAMLQLRADQPAKAIATLEATHLKSPRDLAVVDMLAGLAWSSQNWSGLEKYEGWLREIEGERGSLWRAYRAQRLLGTMQATTDAQFAEAASISAALVRERPRWSKAHYLQGEIAERSGKANAAITAFEQAWQCGGPNVMLADRLIDLLTQQGRVDEAAAYVAQVGNYLSTSSQLFDRALPYYADGDGTDEALRVAEDWLRRQPDDPMAHLRVARILRIAAAAASGEQRADLVQRAEEANKKAIELAPGDVRPWISWVAFAAQSDGGRDRALALLKEFAGQLNIDPMQRAYVLAQLYQGLGMPSEAHEYFGEAIELARTSDDSAAAANVFIGAARLYLQSAPELAARFAHDALRLQPTNRGAKALLLQALARQNSPVALQEALRVLSELLPGEGSDGDADERRLRAVLLARRHETGDVERAIELVDGIPEKTPDDRLLLAKLYEESGRVGPAFQLLEQLVDSPTPRPQDLYELLRFWQTHFISKAGTEAPGDQFAGRAQQVYDRMTGSPAMLAARLQWKLREQKVRNESEQLSAAQVDETLTGWLNSPDVQAMAAGPGAQQLFHELFATLLREGARESAFQLAQTPPTPLDEALAPIRLFHALIVVQPDEQLQHAANPTVTALIASHATEPDILQAAADYYFMTGRYDTAVDLYQRVLEIESSRPQAMNNLALALAELPSRRSESSAVIDEAIRLAPDEPSFLDTRAVLDIIGGRPQEAVETLKKLQENQSVDPVIELHWAAACRALGEESGVDSHVTKAIGLGIQGTLLSARDRGFLTEWMEAQSPTSAPTPEATNTKTSEPASK